MRILVRMAIAMEFRAATAGDVETLVELRKQLVAACGAPAREVDGELRAYFQRQLAGGSFVEWLGFDNGRAVASATIVFYEFVPSDANRSGIRGYITNMYTAPEHRGKGIATFLLGKLAEEARARGVKRLWLHAAEMGRPVYLKFGFREANGFLELNL